MKACGFTLLTSTHLFWIPVHMGVTGKLLMLESSYDTTQCACLLHGHYRLLQCNTDPRRSQHLQAAQIRVKTSVFTIQSITIKLCLQLCKYHSISSSIYIRQLCEVLWVFKHLEEQNIKKYWSMPGDTVLTYRTIEHEINKIKYIWKWSHSQHQHQSLIILKTL